MSLLIWPEKSTPPGLGDLLRDWFGYQAHVENSYWVIPDTDHALRQGPKSILTMGPAIPLTSKTFHEVSLRLADVIHPEFEEGHTAALKGLPKEVKTQGGLGLHSEISKCLIDVSISNKTKLPKILSEALLPLMHEKLNAKFVVPVSINASKQQSYFSFAKASFIAQHQGEKGLEEFQKRRDSLSGIEMSGGLEILTFVDAMTRLSPMVFTLPVHSHGCSWHFYADGVYMLPRESNVSLLQEFVLDLSPRIESAPTFGLLGMSNMGEANIWRLLNTIVDGVNRLFTMLNDHRQFVDDEMRYDPASQLKSYASIYVLFSDLLSLNSTINPHNRVCFTFSFLDKLANLKTRFSGTGRSEVDNFKVLASLQFGKEVRNILRQALQAYPDEFVQSFLPTVGQCYGQIHRDIGRDLRNRRADQNVRLERLRDLRNMHHGAFLQKGSFERIYSESKGVVPREIVTLPYLLTLALLLRPRELLDI